MAALTGTDIANRVKRQFGDESGVQVTTSDILMWINDALSEAATQNDSSNISSTTLASTEGTNVYTHSVDIMSIHSILYRKSATDAYTPLTFVPAQDFLTLFPNWKVTPAVKGTPVIYSSEGLHSFKVYPAPDVTFATAFSIRSNARFLDVSDLEFPLPVGAKYYQYILEYCLMKAYEMDENWEAADRKAAFIQSTLNTLHSEDNNLDHSKYPVISTVFEDLS